MRYLLHQNQLGELSARQKYLYDIFRMYFLPGKPEGGYIPLTPMGGKGPDVLFITGHTPQVQAYLELNYGQISENMIVITSCFGKTFKRFAAKKTIYVPDLCHNFCVLRDGDVFGFGFDISDAELDFYNASGDIMERIRSAYDKL